MLLQSMKAFYYETYLVSHAGGACVLLHRVGSLDVAIVVGGRSGQNFEVPSKRQGSEQLGKHMQTASGE